MPGTIQRDKIPELAAQLYGGDMNKAQAFIVQNGIQIVDQAPITNEISSQTSNIIDKIPNVLSPNFLGIKASQKVAGALGAPEAAPPTPTVGSALREAPDVLQGGLAVTGGIAAGPAGAIAGGAFGSVLQNALRKLSPSIFGNPTSVQKVIENVTGANVSTASLGIPDFASNVLDDIILDTATIAAPGSGTALKNVTGRTAGRTFGTLARVRPLSDRVPKIENTMATIARELGKGAPSVRIGASDKIVNIFERLSAPRSFGEFNFIESQKVKKALPRLAGIPALDDSATTISESTAKAFNKSVFRKGNVIPITAGETSASRKRAIEFTLAADKRFNNMRNGANNLWGRLREVLKNDTFSLSDESLDALADMKTQVDIQYFSGTPEVRASLSKLKNDLDSLIPGATKGGPTPVTTRSTKITEQVTTPKTTTAKVGTKKSETTAAGGTTELEEVTARAGKTIKIRERTDVTQVDKALSYGENLELLKAANGKYNFDQIRDITTKLAGDIPSSANISFGDRNRIDIINKLKGDIQEQILIRPDGPAVAKLYGNALEITRKRYEIFPKDIQNTLSKEAAVLWDRVFRNEDYSKAFIRAAGDTEQARTEVVSRLLEKATNNIGEIDPKILKSIWDDNKGLRAAFSVKQRNNLDQYFEILRHINTSELSEIGMTAMGMKVGTMAIAIPAALVGGAILGDATGAGNITGGVAGTTVALIGMNQFTKKVLLGGGEFPRAALRLAKLPPGAASAKDVKTIMTALHGSKIALVNRDEKGNVTVINPEFKLNTKQNRRTRSAGFGQFGESRR